MWIMLTSKLPTAVSPPRMSIFWAEDWSDSELTNDQIKEFLREKISEDYEFFLDADGAKLSTELLQEKARRALAKQRYATGRHSMGLEPNFAGAVGIFYKGERIRVFPHEFSALTQKNMALYIGNTDQPASHILIPESSAQRKIYEDIMNGLNRDVYDAALLDGCNHNQAITVALGVDITDDRFMADFPVIGWYKILPEYGAIFCSEYEMEETDRRDNENSMVIAKEKKAPKFSKTQTNSA